MYTLEKEGPQVIIPYKNTRLHSFLAGISLGVGSLISSDVESADLWQTLRPSLSCKANAKDIPIDIPTSKLSELIRSLKGIAESFALSDAVFHYYPVIIRDPLSGRVSIIELRRERKQRKIQNGKNTKPQLHDVWPGDFRDITTCDFGVTLKPNGLNTQIIVTDTTGKLYDVLGWIGHYRVGDTIKKQAYTPVTQFINNPSLISEGKERLGTYIRNAKQWIQDSPLEVRFGGESIPLDALVPEGLIESLVVIEKMDPSEYTGDDIKMWENTMQEQIPRIYGRLGANQEDAFMSQVSGAKACGISQYTSKSWDTVRKRIPGLHLGEFESGCRDHESSIRAMFGHIEMEVSDFQKKGGVPEWLQNEGREYYPLIMAMGYNSNASRLAGHLSKILESKKQLTPKKVLEKLLPKLPRKYIDEKNPHRGYQVSETLFYSMKFLYFQRHVLGKDTPHTLDAYEQIVREIQRQKNNPLPLEKKDGKK